MQDPGEDGEFVGRPGVEHPVQPIKPGRTGTVEAFATGHGHLEQRRAAVGRIGAPLHQAEPLKGGDLPAHRALADAQLDGQVGQPRGAGPVEPGEQPVGVGLQVRMQTARHLAGRRPGATQQHGDLPLDGLHRRSVGRLSKKGLVASTDGHHQSLSGPRIADERPYGPYMGDRDVLLAEYDRQLRDPRTGPPLAGVAYEPDGPLLRKVGDVRGGVTSPSELGVDGADLDALIVRQRDFFAARGEAIEWGVRAHDRPADLGDRLLAAGFAVDDVSTVLIGVVTDLLAEPSLPDGVTIRETSAERDLQAIGDHQSAVWGLDLSVVGEMLVKLVNDAPEAVSVLVLEAGGVIVTDGWVVYRPGTDFAGLRGGSTLQGWRGRGLYRALVARRAQLAADRGYRYLQVDASEESRPILERLGFQAITTRTMYVWTP